MKKSRCTEEQINFSLRQTETGTAIQDITRKLGISEQTFLRWKKMYAGLGVVVLRRLNHKANTIVHVRSCTRIKGSTIVKITNHY